nr:DEAD-box ATP-dependent RNA helicase 57 [Tanacetum cinerariifolium]
RASKDGVRAVILCPTRELASQTYRECKKLAKGKKFYIKLMTKQLSNTAEFAKLSCDVLISTPLRLKSSVTKRKLDLSRSIGYFEKIGIKGNGVESGLQCIFRF